MSLAVHRIHISTDILQSKTAQGCSTVLYCQRAKVVKILSEGG